VSSLNGEGLEVMPGETAMPTHKTKPVAFKTAEIAGVKVFFREAGDPAKPTIANRDGAPRADRRPDFFRTWAFTRALQPGASESL
jgi:hypothetical protein